MKSAIPLPVFKKLEKTVINLCPLIEQQLEANGGSLWTEYELRRELVACILGSQVRQEMANTALNRLEQAGLLNDDWWNDSCDLFRFKVFDVLSGRIGNFHKKWCYRFPRARSMQLLKTRNTIAKRSISKRLSDFSDPKSLREHLVQDISGFGPKQASMFIRNIGKSYDLAIIDTHVLHFMNCKNMLCFKNIKINTVKAYEHVEKHLVNYANELGYPAGYMDWAIWATMRAASELGI